MENYQSRHHIGHYMEAVGLLHGVLSATEALRQTRCDLCDEENDRCLDCQSMWSLVDGRCVNDSGLQGSSAIASGRQLSNFGRSSHFEGGKVTGGWVCASSKKAAMGLPDPDKIAVFKLTELLRSEREILAIALTPLGWSMRANLLQPGSVVLGNEPWRNSRQNWFQILTTVAATRSLAFGLEDAAALRRHAYLHFDWDPPPVRDHCRRSRCLLLYRVPNGPLSDQDGQRRMSNEDDIIREMEENGCGAGNVDRRFTTETMSLRQQAEVFTGYDVIVASHSSQLVFLIWAPPQTTVIEVRHSVTTTLHCYGKFTFHIGCWALCVLMRPRYSVYMATWA